MGVLSTAVAASCLWGVALMLANGIAGGAGGFLKRDFGLSFGLSVRRGGRSFFRVTGGGGEVPMSRRRFFLLVEGDSAGVVAN